MTDSRQSFSGNQSARFHGYNITTKFIARHNKTNDNNFLLLKFLPLIKLSRNALGFSALFLGGNMANRLIG